MKLEFRLHKDLMRPMRWTLHDVLYYYGKELLDEGFDLMKEILFSVTYDYEEVGHLLKVYQDDRFRVRPENEFYPFAIL